MSGATVIVDNPSALLLFRLRRQIESGQFAMGGGSISSDGKCEMWGGEPLMIAANPDGEAAAQRIEYLESCLKLAKVAVNRLASGEAFTGAFHLDAKRDEELLARMTYATAMRDKLEGCK